MVWEGKAGLTEAVVTGSGWAVLFYGQQLLGEGLSLGEVRDAAFTLSGENSAQNPLSLGEGSQLITQAITEGHIKPRGPGHPQSIFTCDGAIQFLKPRFVPMISQPCGYH